MNRRALVISAVASVLLLAAAPSARDQGAAPTLQGAWRQEGQSAMLIATKTYAAFFGIDGLPALSTYAVDGDRVTLQPSPSARSFNDAILEDDLGIKASRDAPPVTLERVDVRADTLRFTTPDGITRTFRRLE
jgi:hypothetical protein